MKKLVNAVKNEFSEKNSNSFSLNFKIEGQDSEKYDVVAKKLNKSRTELAKFIILNSLDDLIEQLGSLNSDNSKEQPEFDDLAELILKIIEPKIADLVSGATFELKELAGDDWNKFGDHGNRNRVGKKFKKLVDSGQIKRVKFIETKPNNHALYEKY
jgi:hypothetical protein